MTARAPSPPLAGVFAGRHLLVTGVTGFVGKVWLSHLLHHLPGIGRVTLLVRPARGGTALDRFASIADTSPAFRPLKLHQGAAYARFLSERVEVLDADVTLPDCGLDAETLARLTSTADAVVHIAGLTDFHPDPRAGVPANVDGAMHAADLAARCRVPRLLHVSTCYVAGTADGPVPERIARGVAPCGDPFDPLEELAHLRDLVGLHRRPSDRLSHASERAAALGWPNLYTFTKGLAEHLLAGRTDIDLAVVRPSVVECARTWPFPGWNEGLNTAAPIMWFCGTPFTRLPANGAHRFDIVPVDAVARWMTVVLAGLLRGTHDRVTHLSTGDVHPVTFARIVELTALGRRRHARRPDAPLVERLIAQLDIQPGPADDPPLLDPGRLEALGDTLAGHLDALAGAPGWVGRLLGEPARTARRHVTRRKRDLGRLRHMLELYRPFIHDHDWCFRSDHVRAAQDALAPVDRAAFSDDAHSMCWRTYWLDVQYAGMLDWAFPVLDGGEVHDDPPSVPPLTLTPPDALAAVHAGAA